MAGRFVIKENGNCGYETIDRTTGKAVASSASYEFCDKSVSRLNGESSWSKEEAQEYYGVKQTTQRPGQQATKKRQRGMAPGKV